MLSSVLCSTGYDAGDLVLYPESQTKQFQNFITRANRYPSLVMGGASGGGASSKGTKKVVLVEVMFCCLFFFKGSTIREFETFVFILILGVSKCIPS